MMGESDIDRESIERLLRRKQVRPKNQSEERTWIKALSKRLDAMRIQSRRRTKAVDKWKRAILSRLGNAAKRS